MSVYPTAAESKLIDLLNELNGGVLKGKFTTQRVLAGKYILDIYFFEIALAIEVDGSFHNSPEQQVIDKAKNKACERQNITLLRVTNSDVFGDRASLIDKLRNGWRSALMRRQDYAER